MRERELEWEIILKQRGEWEEGTKIHSDGKEQLHIRDILNDSKVIKQFVIIAFAMAIPGYETTK